MKLKKHPELNLLISDCGRVFKEYSQFERSGYLATNYFSKKYSIHRLVAETWVENPDNKPCVCHKDDNPKNNKAENLWWGTHQENMDDMIKKGRNINKKQIKEEHSKINELVCQGYSQREIAKMFGVTEGRISQIIKKLKKYGLFIHF